MNLSYNSLPDRDDIEINGAVPAAKIHHAAILPVHSRKYFRHDPDGGVRRADLLVAVERRGLLKVDPDLFEFILLWRFLHHILKKGIMKGPLLF